MIGSILGNFASFKFSIYSNSIEMQYYLLSNLRNEKLREPINLTGWKNTDSIQTQTF